MPTLYAVNNTINAKTTERDFYNELIQSTTVSDLKRRIAKIINQLGFTDYSFAPLDTDYDSCQTPLSTYPAEYQNTYRRQALYQHDMLISFFQLNNHPTFTSQFYDYYSNAPFNIELTNRSRAIRQLRNAFGIYESYVIPLTDDDNKHKLLLTLTNQNMEATAFQAKVSRLSTPLRLLGQAIYTVQDRKFATVFKQTKPNTGLLRHLWSQLTGNGVH